MLGIPIGLLYASFGEWFIHKKVLHEWGQDKESFWNFHFDEHHALVRQNDFKDPSYDRDLLNFDWNPQTKEAVGLAILVGAHMPLFPIFPFFTGTILFSGIHYYTTHKRAHQDPEWAKEHLPWHYDHHMGKNQHANWGVTNDWADRILGTKIPYHGTEDEKRDLEKKRLRVLQKQ